jgi:uncharacterized C2H2 Zn-finger protein
VAQLRLFRPWLRLFRPSWTNPRGGFPPAFLDCRPGADTPLPHSHNVLVATSCSVAEGWIKKCNKSHFWIHTRPRHVNTHARPVGGLLHNKQGPCRARLRGAPLPHSHNALAATSCPVCPPAAAGVYRVCADVEGWIKKYNKFHLWIHTRPRCVNTHARLVGGGPSW